jgi:hypothetical protein
MMDRAQEFRAQAIRLESTAAQRADALGDAMRIWNNKAVEAFCPSASPKSKSRGPERLERQAARKSEGPARAASATWAATAAHAAQRKRA